MAVSRAEDFDLHPHVYLQGQTITTEGSEVRYIHVIVDGEVDIVELPDPAPAMHRHACSARSGPATTSASSGRSPSAKRQRSPAPTARTIAVRRDQAPQLQQALAAAGPLRSESGHMPALRVDPGSSPGDA